MEQLLRAQARNSDNDARKVLADLLTEEGRMAEMPFLIDDWQVSLRRATGLDPFLQAGGRFEPLVLWNGFRVSLQAGEYLYSTPARYLDNPRRYEAWEVAIFWPDEKWFDVGRTFPEVGDRLNFEMGDCPVAGRVPVAEVTWLLRFLEKLPPPTTPAPVYTTKPAEPAEVEA